MCYFDCELVVGFVDDILVWIFGKMVVIFLLLVGLIRIVLGWFDVKIDYIVCDYDCVVWLYVIVGFFKVKKKILSILLIFGIEYG